MVMPRRPWGEASAGAGDAQQDYQRRGGHRTSRMAPDHDTAPVLFDRAARRGGLVAFLLDRVAEDVKELAGGEAGLFERS